MRESETRFATCPLCEATCGLAIEVAGGEIVKVRGDDADVFSKGFICPKGASIGELHADPDRIRTPMVRRDGELVPASWDEAFAAIEERLAPIREDGDRNATAVYLGNPNAHTLDGLIYLRALIKAMGTRNIFSATSVDQLPKQIASASMFGTGLSLAIPDVDRTDYMLILGANPLASNGSLMTAPDMRGRLRGIQERGGRIVVVDPRRTRTAEAADEHHPIRPGRDALSSPPSSTRSSPRTSRTPARSPSTSPASTRSARRSPASTPSPRPLPAASPPMRSAGSPATSPPPRPLPSMPGSARRRRSSARSRAGWSTSSTL